MTAGDSAGLLNASLHKRKTLATIQAEAAEDDSHGGEKYNLLDLLCIGVGSTVGSGVFILTGDILPKAGPSATLSWLIAGAVCMLSALSYIELSMRIPTSGSCYIFSYHALGEMLGVVGAVCLTMEYGISGAGVARNWSALLGQLTGWQNGMFFWYPGADPTIEGSDVYFDYTAGIIMAVTVLVCSSGLRLGKIVINSFTFAKLFLVTFLIIAGFCAWKVDIFESQQTFFPKGVSGCAKGVSALFFGFIGFDEVCCLSGKSNRPTYTMPRALAGTLIAAAFVSTLAQFSLSVMEPAEGAGQWPTAFQNHGWEWARKIANIGELVLLPLVVLLSFLPQPELMAAMAKDGLLPSGFARASPDGTFVWGSNVIGFAMVVIAAAVPFGVLWNMISLGVLLSFNLTNTSLIMVRYGNGGLVVQPGVSSLLRALWLFSSVGAYAFWKGFMQPYLDGEDWQLWAPICGGVCLAAAVGVLAAISRFDEVFDPAAPPVFRTPFSPFTPGLAMILNFMLMATMEWTDHLYLAISIVGCLILYAGVRCVKGRRERLRCYQEAAAGLAPRLQ